ncbi:dynein-related subfamily AAA family protein [Novosphingobium sp. PhB57]|nr:dynein-related subfamily AAA family protein [Novosphingobium sp. PhB57]
MADGARTGFAADRTKNGYIRCAFVPEMLASFLHNMPFIFKWGTETEEEPSDLEAEISADNEFTAPINAIQDDLPHNRIFYGAPGTGKSHNLKSGLERYFPDKELFERTTFFPEYTSGMFMGAYRPTPIYRAAEGQFFQADQKQPAPSLEPIIDYRHMPGPFLRLLAKALSHPEHNFCLVIEELNRANASAVFADAFQMLDRDDDGTGKYEVTLPQEAQDYLATHGHLGPVWIPSNMYIWATMNSADQGVFPMDSAFKRRWSMEYLGIDDGEEVVKDWEMSLPFITTGPIKWNKFRKAINIHLARQGIAEDRLIGPFFMTRKDLAKPKAFEDKIIQYLRDDVMRTAPGKLFAGEAKSFGALVSAYRRGENIFVQDIKFGDD